MIQINDTIVSLDIVQKKFVCDVQKCKGLCCVHGDSGAPLNDDEAQLLEKEYDVIKPYMRKKGIEAIEQKGKLHMIDRDGDLVTVLVDNKECAFVIFEAGVARCAIEKAFFDKKISFQKPVSCHLYPARVKKYRDFEGINYDKWGICKPAIENGENTNTYLYEFLKEPFIRKYGKEWYKQLVFAAKEINKHE